MERTLVPARLGDHLDRLYRADCALCGSREDAEDLVQDVRPRPGPAGLLRHDDDLGYLLRALRNTFLTQKLTERRRLRPTRNPNSSTSSPTRERGSPRPRSRPASCVPRSPHGNRCRLAVSVAEEGSSTRKDTDEAMTATVRELAQRRSGTDEILLLWRPEIDRVELFLRDVATGAGFLIEVEPSRAIDAFHHPYAYAPRRGKSRRVLRSEKTIVDG
jgi:DNA-directed RNA polymerase specialized sigma24 family protein